MSDVAMIAGQINRHFTVHDEKTMALDNLYHANPDEIVILADILKHIHAKDQFREILNGAHVELMDNHSHYDRWKQLKSAGKRGSSHKSDGQQYQIVGRLSHAILFGYRGDRTWVQLENTPYGGVKNRILHTVDFFHYWGTQKNIGPYGKSVHNDKRPILLFPR